MKISKDKRVIRSKSNNKTTEQHALIIKKTVKNIKN